MKPRRIRVLIVEDSPTTRDFLVLVMNSDPGLEVVGTATDGDEVLAAVRRLHPDVVTMDIYMQRMNGLEATRRVMQQEPVPIIVLSGMVENQVAATFSALEAGALAFLPRPSDPADVAELLRTVKLMSEVKVVRRRERRSVERAGAVALASSGVRIVAVGASTGGPLAIKELLGSLPESFASPVLIVQHIAAGFLEGFVRWLNTMSGIPVREATDGETARPGHAYVAPDGRHMGIDRQLRIKLGSSPAEHGMRPAISFLLRSVRSACGAQAAAVLLTGMGKDGAEELLALRQCGALTFAQDAQSSVVHGMPGEAIRLGAAVQVMAPAEIGAALRDLHAAGPQTGTPPEGGA